MFLVIFIVCIIIYYGSQLYAFIAADFTLFLYVTSVFPILSSCLKYQLRGTTISARLSMAHASVKTLNPGSNPPTTCNDGFVGTQ